MSARPKTPTHADEKHAVLYGHPIPENSFAVRDLQHKLPGVGLFDLRRTETGAHACTFCGACQKACPVDCIDVRLDRSRTHGKGKERHFAGTITVDERRCVTCNHCVETCKFDALIPTELFTEHRRRVQELANKPPQLSSGHGLCSGCGAGLVVNQVLGQVKNHYVVSGATGCLEVSTTRYPYTAWKGSYIHTNFENAAATLSGVETAFRALYKQGKLEDKVKFIAFGGDGGTYDIGLQSLSGAMERGHQMLYVCYDNGAYMNTGFQRSGATPQGAWTTTSPVGKAQSGKIQNRKNLTDIMIAHELGYVAQASPHDPRDLVRKSAKALDTPGATFINVLAPCPRGWRADGAETIELAREAVETCYWPLFEVVDGEYRLTYRPHHKKPLIPWLKRQGRFAHLFKPGNEESLLNLEAWVDNEWEKLLRKCGEPSEAEWQEYLQSNGCLLR
jgi:pyruvate ferredoxin oxidoreductase beta subunit